MMWFKGLFKLMIIIRLYDLINRLNCLAMKSKKTTQECQIGYYEFLLSSGPCIWCRNISQLLSLNKRRNWDSEVLSTLPKVYHLKSERARTHMEANLSITQNLPPQSNLTPFTYYSYQNIKAKGFICRVGFLIHFLYISYFQSISNLAQYHAEYAGLCCNNKNFSRS